uniref:AAA domain-containing protein n=1 Tax=Meloidogyne hapla TaxID=6305 RepID=A0A1I8AXJ5_MELHA
MVFPIFSYAASSCSSLSSALSEPLDDDQFSTSDLTTASSSGGQNSPEKHPNMDFIGFRAPHPPQRQQQFLQPPKMRTIQNRGSPSNLMGPLGMPVSNKYIQQNKIIHPQQWQQPNNNNRYSVATTSDITRPSTSCSGNNVHFSSSDGGHILLRNSLNNSGAQWTDPKESTNVHFYAQPGGAFEEYSPPSSTSQSSSYFRAYHTFTSANFQQIQQQRNQQRRILSPPHHLMALSDDGDTLSVAAGEIGGQQQQQMLSSAFGRRPMNGQQTGENNDSSIRHPAYHTHSLDRHAHLRIFQQPRIPPMQNGGIPTRNGNIKLSTQTKQQNNQFNSLLISPRHFAYPSSTFASTPNNQMMQQDKKMGSNNAHIQQNNNLIQRINSNNFNQNYRPQSSARSCAIFEEENISNKRSASLSAMSRSMVTVINGNNTKQLNEQQQINEKNNSENRESRVIEYIQQLINLQNKRNKSFKQQQIPLPPPRRTAISPNFLNRVPLSLPRNDGSRIYSNLPNNVQQQKFSSANNSCLNSPNKIQLISSDEIIQQQPGSQLSLISSLGSTYTNNIEERYEWEVNKLQSELESYRTTVSLLNQRHSGYNCMLQIFDTKLQTIMLSLSKLQQKRHVKRNEVERLCREIEHLRSLSISAGVVPKEQQQLNIKKENNNSLPPSNDKEIIEKEKNIKIINEKSSSVGRGEQTEGGGKKAGWKTNVVVDNQIRSSFTRAFQKGSSKKNKQTQQQTNEEEKQKINEENIDGKKNEQQPFYVKSLKKELENKELALTDVQLDALDKAKEIDILRETVNKLQHENRMLKYNFSLLERRVRSESRASSHISLNTNLCSGGPPDCSGGDLDVDALEEVKMIKLDIEKKIYRKHVKYYKSTTIYKKSTTNNSSTLPPSSSCSLASISRASSGSSSTLSSLGSALSGCGNKRRELSIGHLSLPLAEGINWRDLDQQLGLLLEEYLHRIDPDLSLGVDSYSSIIGYQIIPKNSLGIPNEWLIRRRNSIDDYLNIKNNQNNEMEELNPKLSPEEVLQPGTLIRLRLRGVSQHSVDSLVLESLFPRNLLEQLLDQLEKYRRLILFGTAGIGKSNLARLIAKYYLMKFNIELNNKSLIEIHFPTENNNLMENETKIQQAKEQLFNALNSQNNLFSTFILLDNLPLKYLNGIVFDVFQSFDLKNKSSKNKLIPFVICTLNRTNLAEQLIIQKLQIYHNFHLCPLNQKMEAVNGYLGRYLRRRMAEQTLSSISTSLPSSSLSLNSLDSLIDFLNRSLYLINEFIERTANGGSNVTLGPRILLQCPLEGDQAKEWFIRLWNDKLVPYLRKAVIEGNNPKSDLIDLTEQIRSIWLWQNFSEELKRIEIK